MPGGLVILRDAYPSLSETRVVIPLTATVWDPGVSTKLLYLPRP